MCSYVFLCIFFTRMRPPHRIFLCILMCSDVFLCILLPGCSYVFFYPDAPSAPDLLCIRLYSDVFLCLMYSFTRTRHPHQYFLCMLMYLFLCILMCSYVFLWKSKDTVIQLLMKEQTDSDTALVVLVDLIDHLDFVVLTNIAYTSIP